MTAELHIDGPTTARPVILAHGAGAPMDSPFMNAIAEGLADKGHRVVRFEFPYMRRRREDGKKRGPDRAAVLIDCWREVAQQFDSPLAVGGKSMGGRIASMLADELGAAALVCFGYPFHPAGKPENTRIEHLQSLATPALILQGERDALGSREEVAAYRLAETIQFHWLGDGDHSFKPRKKSGRTEQQNWEEAVGAADEFLSGRLG